VAEHPRLPDDEERKEEEVLSVVGTVYVQVFVPFVRRALVEGVYGVAMGKTDAPLWKDLKGALDDWEHWTRRESNGKSVE